MPEGTVVGLRPWLPWPLYTWRSWTEPVRAERLAALRIGLAFIVLLDVVTSYLSAVNDYYGPDSLSRVDDLDVYGFLSRGSHFGWSLLRGFGHPLNLALAFVISLTCAVWMLAGLWPRKGPPPPGGCVPDLRWGVVAWLASLAWLVLGSWARWRAVPEFEGPLSLATAGMFWLAATGFLALAVVPRLWSASAPDARRSVLLLCVAWLVATGFLVLAALRNEQAPLDRDTFLGLDWLFNPADEDPQMLWWLMVLYAAVTVLLLLGLWTRLSALAVWALSWSFANLNAGTDSNGDVARGILLFYLVVSPCGAAWSLDRWLARRQGAPAGPVYVHPWPLRLLLLQMICLYFFNGLYKLCGEEWRTGNSLYYVMANAAMARVSYEQFQLPLEVLRVLSWTVVAWEVSFPILVAIPVVRTLALWFGVLFHVGIWASMELGAFGPYMLCFYLPLVPWERWVKAPS
jgi:hypothetical protein